MSNECRYCGKQYASRSGVWKHEQKCDKATEHSSYEDKYESPVEETTVSHAESPPVPESENDDEGTFVSDEAGGTSFTWMDFDMGEQPDNTDTIPTTLKVVAAQKPPKNPKKMTQKEKDALKDTNMALLKMGLTGADALLSTYGKKVCDDKDFVVKHSEKDKNLVATAQWEWMAENDIILSAHISKGVIATALTAHYIGAPVLRINKNAKKPLGMVGGRIGGFFKRLPLIGRLFGRKKKKMQLPTDVIEVDEQ